jgi:shikimate dehydrogenase
MQIPFKVVSRHPDRNSIEYLDMPEQMKEQNLIINTTPLGMFPGKKYCPDIPYEVLTSGDILFDLIYNPAETLFLKLGRDAGCKTKNGLEMLQMQAEKSWEIWNS